MANLVRIVAEVRKEFPPVLDFGNMSPEMVLSLQTEGKQQFVDTCMKRYEQECRKEEWEKSYTGRFCNYVRGLFRKP
jgi:hypothetical protein